MGAVYSVSLACDYRGDAGEKCARLSPGVSEPEERPKRAKARARAAANGWRYLFGPTSCSYDLCPEHAEEVPAQTFRDWKGAAPIDPLKYKRARA